MAFIQTTSQVLYAAVSAMGRLLKTAFSTDEDVMSDDIRQIMSHPDDRKKFMEAINKLQNQKEVTIELSNKETLTLVQ